MICKLKPLLIESSNILLYCLSNKSPTIICLCVLLENLSKTNKRFSMFNSK